MPLRRRRPGPNQPKQSSPVPTPTRAAAAVSNQAMQDEVKTKPADDKSEPGLLESFFGGFKGADNAQPKDDTSKTPGFLDSLKNQFSVAPSEDQRESLEAVKGLLDPSLLGGADGTFNFADIDAVTQALMKDTCGLSAEAQKQLLSQGKGFQARMVRKAMGGGRGPLKKAVRNRVYDEAPANIRAQLEAGLLEAGVDPKTGEIPDTEPRTLNFEAMNAFQEHATVLQQMQQDAEDRFGIRVTMPGGLSKPGVQHSLDGAFGLPPGAKVSPPKKKE